MAISFENIVALSSTVEVVAETDGMSAYGVYAIAKAVFEKMGIEDKFVTKTGRELASQAFYNYAKNGSINGVKSSTQRFNDDEVENFIARMIAKATR